MKMKNYIILRLSDVSTTITLKSCKYYNQIHARYAEYILE